MPSVNAAIDLAPTSLQHIFLEVSNVSEDLDYLVQVCLIKVGVELCRNRFGHPCFISSNVSCKDEPSCGFGMK